MSLETNLAADYDPATAAALDRLYVIRAGATLADDVLKHATLADLPKAVRVALGDNNLSDTATLAQVIAFLRTVKILPVSAPTWSPAAISNLDAWWKPTPASTGTVAGLPVASLANSAPGGLYPAAQSVSGKRPVLTADGSTGNFYLQCDGVSQALEVAGLPSRANHFTWAVYAWDYPINAAGAQQGSIWGREQATGGTRLALVVQNNGVGRLNYTGYNQFAGADVQDNRTRAAGVKSVAMTTFVNAAGTTTHTYTTPTLGSTTTGSGSSALSEGEGTFSLGYGSASAPYYYGGRLYEIGRTNGPISGGELTLLTADLSARYGSLV